MEKQATKPKMLVTAVTVSDLAQNLLRAGSADLIFMPGTIDEAALLAALARGDIAANNILCWLRGEVHDARNFLNPEVVPRGC